MILHSTVALTHELDNIPRAASELAEQTFSKIKLQDNSFGILLCDSDTDHQTLFNELKKKLDIPIIGGSTIGIITGEKGLTDMSASLMTITSEDAFFSFAASKPLTTENVTEEIEATYRNAPPFQRNR